MSESAVAGNERIVEVLHALVTQTEATGVRELAQALGASRSTVNRVLLSLEEHGLASVSGNGNYQVGPRLRVLGAALHARHPLLHHAGTVLEKLGEQSDATVLIALHDAPRPRAVVVACRRRPGPIKYLLEPGTVLPLHAGATGRSILGRLGISALGDEPLEAHTPDTVTDRTELEGLLAEDTRAGYTISVGQQFPLAAGAAAPFQCHGLTGSVSITRPRFLTSDEDLQRFGPMAREAAQSIETACTGNPAPRHLEPITFPAGSTAVERTVRLITAMAANPNGLATGTDLARAVGANIATTNRLVSTALASGLALQLQGGLHPGPRMFHWASLLGPDIDPAQIARPILRQLAEASGETIGLIQFRAETGEAVMTTVVDGVRPLHYGLASGVPIPLYAGAGGKAILAYRPRSEVEALTLEPLTERTQTDLHALEKDLEEIRERGWALGDGERIPDAFGVSAPYFINGTIAGSITATVTRFRLPEIDVQALARMVQQAAQGLTRILSTP
ncbi:UNVERIFIED_ORG: DNA-binding IclR family transcriptional regulator [Arthrobacter globiformis]|nr:DNA-binding IclR family transcriptional regulator [Arthrobacter globiformis]